MNIYVRMVINAREYHSKLLLGFLAAARGHHVLVGEIPKISPATPRGIFHTGDLNVRKHTFFEKLLAQGMSITAHDEEHGLILEDFGPTIDVRFSRETVEQVTSSFSWGKWDNGLLRNAFPEHAHKFRLSGSPRVDFWRPHPVSDSLVLDAERTQRPPSANRPLILIASNFGPGPTPSWNLYGRTRAAELGVPPATRLAGLESVATTVRIMFAFVCAIDALATAIPEADILVRPHPTEEWGALSELIERRANVLVSREHTLSAQLRRADLLVHNSCTSGFEAAVLGVPTIAYAPEGLWQDSVSNRLARIATSREELIEAVRDELRARRGPTEPSRVTEHHELIRDRLHLPEGRLSAELIVDEWERIAERTGLADTRPLRLDGFGRWPSRAVLAVRRPRSARASRTRRSALPHTAVWQVDADGNEVAALQRDESVRFPPFDRARVEADVARLTRASGGTPVAVRLIGPRLIALWPRSRRR